MRNPGRIDPTIELISRIWKRNPDLRLMQLLMNAHKHPDPYYVEDSELYQELIDLYSSVQPPQGSVDNWDLD